MDLHSGRIEFSLPPQLFPLTRFFTDPKENSGICLYKCSAAYFRLFYLCLNQQDVSSE